MRTSSTYAPSKFRFALLVKRKRKSTEVVPPGREMGTV
jgi:hypothetical protein